MSSENRVDKEKIKPEIIEMNVHVCVLCSTC